MNISGQTRNLDKKFWTANLNWLTMNCILRSYWNWTLQENIDAEWKNQIFLLERSKLLLKRNEHIFWKLNSNSISCENRRQNIICKIYFKGHFFKKKLNFSSLRTQNKTSVEDLKPIEYYRKIRPVAPETTSRWNSDR